jgi:tetratricopeptide (TPR) repeat protein
MAICLASLWGAWGMRKGASAAKKPVWATLLLIMLLFFTAHLYYTSQRGGILALGAAFMLFCTAWAVGQRMKRRLVGVVVSLLLAGAICVTGAAGVMAMTKHKTGSAFPLDVSLLIRYQSYVSASNMILDKPLLGFGPGVYGISYSTYWTKFEQEWFAQELRMNAHVHNDPMELAIDAGLPAAGLYLTMLILGMSFGLLMAFTAAETTRRRLGYMFAAFFCAFLVDGMFGFNLRVPVSASLLFLFMGALDGLWLPATEVAQTARTSRVPAWAWKLAGAACLITLLYFVDLGTRAFASEYYQQRGMVAQEKKDYPKATEFYEAGERMAPWNWQFERRLGQVCMGQGDMEGAVKHLDAAVQCNPYYLMNYLPLARAKMLLAQRQLKDDPKQVDTPLRTLDEAAEEVEKVLKTAPTLPQAEDLLGRIYSISAVCLSAANRPEEADRVNRYWAESEEHLLKAIEYGATDQCDLYRMLAKVRIAEGKDEGAEEALVRAAQANPADQETWPFFLEFATSHKRYDRLRDTLYSQIDRMKEANPPNQDALSTAYLWLASVLENGYDNLDAVENAYEGAVQYGARRPEIWTNFARFAYEKQRTDSLKKAVVQSCQRLEAEKEKALPQVAAVYAVLQQGPDALNKASTLLMSQFRAHPRNSPMTAGQTFGWAARIMLEVLSGAPPEKACEAYFNLGIISAGMEQLKMADQLFSRAMGCLPADQQPFLALHWADTLMRLDRSNEALALLKDAKNRYPENLDERWALARTLAKLGQYVEAREEYQALLDKPGLDPKGREMIEKEMNSF